MHQWRLDQREGDQLTCTVIAQENNDKVLNLDSGAELGRTHAFEMGSKKSWIWWLIGLEVVVVGKGESVRNAFQVFGLGARENDRATTERESEVRGRCKQGWQRLQFGFRLWVFIDQVRCTIISNSLPQQIVHRMVWKYYHLIQPFRWGWLGWGGEW